MATSWTDPTLSGKKATSAYMDQLRNALKLELVRRGQTAAFTDPTLSPNINTQRAIHVNELHKLIWNINGYTGYTDGTVMIGTTRIRAVHLEELRKQVNNLENKPTVDKVSDCRGGCVGLCISCTATCTGSCVNSCSLGCNSNCTGTCKGSCTGSCTGGCTSCNGCNSCTGCGPW